MVDAGLQSEEEPDAQQKCDAPKVLIDHDTRKQQQTLINMVDSQL